jgi:MraZ protein
MAIFLGEYSCKLDDKGRVPFPAAFRAVATNSNGQVCLVAKKNASDKCITLMTEAGWEEHIRHMSSGLNPYDEKHKSLLRWLFRDTDKLEPDAVGRILLSKKFIEQAGIGKDVIFVGLGEKIELWAKAEHEACSIVAEDEDIKALAKERWEAVSRS